MTKRKCIIVLDGDEYNISLEHGHFSGRRTIYVNDNRIIEQTPHRFYDKGSKHEFQIQNHTCVILIDIVGVTFQYDLIVDGISITTGEPASTELTFDPKMNFMKFILYLIVSCMVAFTVGYLGRTSSFFGNIKPVFLVFIAYGITWLATKIMMRRVKK